MPSFCAVVNCNDRYGHAENVSFHKFPLKRPELLSKWETFIQQQRGADWRASRWSSLCSRHFREEDFRSLNERKTLKKSAVPSILRDVNKKSLLVTNTERKTDAGDKEFTEILAIKEKLEDVGCNAKTNCRLCGTACVAAASFVLNNELYAVVQKCFPTLNIQEEDGLPMALCTSCNKNLQQFGDFVDKVWSAQTELQRKFKSRSAEKPVKIKQEPLVRVKQEVAENGYDQSQHESYGGGNDDYDVMAEGTHDEGDDSGTVDHKYELCDFPIINDCDIMEIINLDDPFINIPDDDNTEAQNQDLDSPSSSRVNYLPSAHELLQEHLLMEEHNYAYVDTEEFKEERHVYKTEKTENEERIQDKAPNESETEKEIIATDTVVLQDINNAQCPQQSHNSYNVETCEKRALKPIVTSVSAIQQPGKANSIIVLNESIVKSGCGFQLHECMVCQLKFFSIGSLKEHYTQTHGTPMVTLPTANILPEKSNEGPCKTEKEISDAIKSTTTSEELTNEHFSQTNSNLMVTVPTENINVERADDSTCKTENEMPDIIKCKESLNACESLISKIPTKDSDQCAKSVAQFADEKLDKNTKPKLVNSKRFLHSQQRGVKKRNRHISLNIMATQYQQLRKLYQKLQRKCLDLEQNVEQLQLHPPGPDFIKHEIPYKVIKRKQEKLTNISKAKYIPQTDNNKNNSLTCMVCSKIFSNSNSFRQHKITHSDERRHSCSLCDRSFKRRNGLLQHLKGFHLQVKPFTCVVCKHSYALKCDMLRCKHSALKANKITAV